METLDSELFKEWLGLAGGPTPAVDAPLGPDDALVVIDMQADFLPHDQALNPGEGSFSVQLMADFRDTTTLQSLISKGNETSSVEGWNIFIESGYLYVRMGNGGIDASEKAASAGGGEIARGVGFHG